MFRFSQIVLILFLLIISAGCTSEEEIHLPEYASELDNVTVFDPDAAPRYNLHLESIYSVGDGNPVLFSRVNHIAVDESGRLFAAEGMRGQTKIHVFDKNGEYITAIGRSGSGPGEFRSIIDLIILENELYALDFNLIRFQIFSVETFELNRVSAINITQREMSGDNSAVFPHQIYPLGVGQLLTVFNQLTFETDQLLFYQVNTDGEIISKQLLTLDLIQHLHDPGGTSSAFYDPFGGRGLVAVSGDNRIFTSWSEDFLIRVFDEYGTDLYAFYYPIQRAHLGRSEALDFYGTGESVQPFRRALQNHGIPDLWRAIEHLVADDENRLWVSVITDDQNVYEWWLLDDHGELLARFKWPRTRELLKVKNGRVYLKEEDEETGIHQITAYRLTKTIYSPEP